MMDVSLDAFSRLETVRGEGVGKNGSREKLKLTALPIK